MAVDAVSLVCVDELKILMDIRKLMKCDLPNRVIVGFESGPRIKVESIINGRNSSTRGITPYPP
jgi:ATP-dependent RNA helicase RhlE